MLGGVGCVNPIGRSSLPCRSEPGAQAGSRPRNITDFRRNRIYAPHRQQAENASAYLSRGRQIAVDGRLEWSEYESVHGARVQLHRIVADSVQYLGDVKSSEQSPGDPEADEGDRDPDRDGGDGSAEPENA
jgi:single-stranded DNA-binding protein